MKIALVSPYDFSYPGGVTEHTAALAEALRRRGHGVQILAACSGHPRLLTAEVKVVTRRILKFPVGGAVARVGWSPLSYFRIKRILRAEKFDVIHLQEPLTPGITWPVLMQSRTLGPWVTIGTFHAYHDRPHWLYARGSPIFGKFFARLEGLIAVSPAARQFAEAMFPGQYQLIPNGVDLKRFGTTDPRVAVRAAADKLNILFVGRLDWRKGFQHLLASFLELKPLYPQLSLTVVGPFDSSAWTPYRRISRAGGVTDINFVGYVPPERLADFYQQADIFCAPSVGYESFGIVLLEAMAAGLPVVASDIAGYRSILKSGQEGLLVPPERPPELTAALRQLISQPDLRQAMANRGRQKAQLYSWDRIVDQILAMYHHTIERKQRQDLGVRSQALAFP